MKLKDKTLKEIIDEVLWWSDFDEKPEDVDELIKGDSSAQQKVEFLNQQEVGDLLNRKSLKKLDFYEVAFTELARLAIAEGEYDENGSSQGKEVKYLKDYSNLKLLIQDLGSDKFSLYLKDDNFGYIKPLGICVYEYPLSPELLELDESNRFEYIKDSVLLSIESDLWEDDFDLKDELYSYYHEIPIYSPFINQKIDFEGLLSVKEASHKLDISAARVKKMVADKVLDGYKFGNKLLITKSSVEKRIEYIKKHGKPTRSKEKPNRVEQYKKRSKED